MLNFKKGFVYRMEQSDREEKDRKRYYDCREALNVFQKRQLQKIDKAIEMIVKKIESESNWEYIYPCFTMLSDFSHNEKTGNIDFKMNRVLIDPIYPNNGHAREYSFIDKYKPLLERLEELEKKKQELYKIASPKLNVISYHRFKAEEERKLEKEFSAKWIQYEGDHFVQRYRSEGIKELVKLLNNLVDTPNTEDFYTIVKRKNISTEYKKELFRWLALYSKRGLSLYDKFVDERRAERERKQQERDFLTEPLIKDESILIMMDYNNRKSK